MIVGFDELNFVIASLQYQSRNDGAWAWILFRAFLTKNPKIHALSQVRLKVRANALKRHSHSQTSAVVIQSAVVVFVKPLDAEFHAISGENLSSQARTYAVFVGFVSVF